MIDPALWESLPFRNRTAFLDFLGTHAIWHQNLALAIRRQTGIVYRTYPLGDGGDAPWLLAHQTEHIGAGEALHLPPPGDLASYDLTNAEAFASFCFLHGQHSRQLAQAAGL